jgi:hypothetical protein
MSGKGSAAGRGGGNEGPSQPNAVGLVLVYLGLGMASALVWARIADMQRLPSWHLEMIGGYAPAPNQYRPLTPWLAEWLRLTLPGGNLYTAYLLLRGIVTGVGLWLFDRYLRVWFSPAAAAAGAFCLGAILPFTYFRVVQESDPINLLVFVLAFWALARERDLALIPLVVVGTLNREAAALIPALYLVTKWGRRPAGELAWKTAVLGATWGAVYGTMLAGYGRRSYYCDVVMWQRNAESWVPSVHVLLVFGAMWVLAFLGARRGPTVLRRALWLLPPYVVLHYVVAMVQEVRLFLPFAPVIIPLSWWVLFPGARDARAGEEASEVATWESETERRGCNVPRTLIVFGLALIAAAILLHLVTFIIAIAVPAGVLLVVIGLIWHLVGRREKKE